MRVPWHKESPVSGADRMQDEIILRRWIGKVATERAAEYAKYMAETGAEEIETADGNLGHQITLRDLGDGTSEITALSWWRDMEAVRDFAGDDPGRARYFTVDEIYLIEKPDTVEHHVVFSHEFTFRIK